MKNFGLNIWSNKNFVIEDGLIRSEEHTSELQSHHDLVCRLLLEKKNIPRNPRNSKEPSLVGILLTKNLATGSLDFTGKAHSFPTTLK